MFGTVKALREDLREVVDALDPDALDGTRALRLLDEFVAMERLIDTAKLLVTRRVDETRAWNREGDRTPADFVARKTGTSVGDARAALTTARQVDPQSSIVDAMKAGTVSADQAHEIADACAADPHAERKLVEAAPRDSFAELRDECRRVKAAARDDEIAHDDEIRRSRYLRTWTDREGAGRGEWKLPPEDHARIVARVTAELKAVMADAKAAGAPAESAEAHAADALVRMAEASAGPSDTQVVMHLRLDHTAFVNNRTAPGEICEIEGVGPIPVATARNLSTKAVVHALVTSGTDISLYAGMGRYIPKALELALEARDPVCVALGYSVRDNLETHHRDPVDNDGVTSLENCCRLCKWHHYLCTHHGWRIEGHPGAWEFVPPTRAHERAPPDDLKLAV